MKLPINYATGMIKMNYCRRNNSINEEKFREYANQSLNTFHLNHMWMRNRDKTVQIPMAIGGDYDDDVGDVDANVCKFFSIVVFWLYLNMF